jgi:hypothetical protein
MDEVLNIFDTSRPTQLTAQSHQRDASHLLRNTDQLRSNSIFSSLEFVLIFDLNFGVSVKNV